MELLSLLSQENIKQMTTDTDPLFANSCGKIFADRVVFASSNKESGYTLKTIKKITFKKRYNTGSIAFTFLPGILLFVPYFSDYEDTFIRMMFIGTGLIGLAVSLAKVKTKYVLDIITEKGRRTSITVWEGNKNDAQKFTDKLNAFIVKHKTGTAKKPDFATGLNTAKPVSVK